MCQNMALCGNELITNEIPLVKINLHLSFYTGFSDRKLNHPIYPSFLPIINPLPHMPILGSSNSSCSK